MEVQDLVLHIEKLGLSNKEARVYLACLALEMASVQAIADEAAIKRVTAYVILESLMVLGLVRQTVKGKKTFFVAEDPAQLEILLRRRADELSEQSHNLKQMLPKLKALRTTTKDLPEVKFYTGVESVRGMMDEFFRISRGTGKEILSLNNVDELNQFFPEHSIGQANPNHPLRGIKNRVVYTSARGPLPSTRAENHARSSRYVSYDKYPVSGNVAILGDMLIIVTMVGKTPVGVKIRNAEMGKVMKVLFEMVWDYTAILEQSKPRAQV